MNSLNIFPSMTVAFAITSVFMYALRPVAISIGLIDRSSGRRSQMGDVPIIGGVAMFIGVFAGLTLIHGSSAGLFALFVACLALVASAVWMTASRCRRRCGLRRRSLQS